MARRKRPRLFRLGPLCWHEGERDRRWQNVKRSLNDYSPDLCPFCGGVQPPGGGMLCEGCYDDLLERAVAVMGSGA